MKKLILALSLASFAQISFAQTKTPVTTVSESNYEKKMSEKISKLNATHDLEELKSLSADFAGIAAKESTQWLPNYYAALATLQRGRMLMRNGDASGLDSIADEAQKYITTAQTLSPMNPEIFILEKMLHNLRLWVNPQERFMTEGALGAEALSKAEKLDPANPRITLFRAQDAYFTPEQFGGSKTKAMDLFKKSLEQFKNYKPKSSLDPNWGQGEAEYFLALPK